MATFHHAWPSPSASSDALVKGQLATGSLIEGACEGSRVRFPVLVPAGMRSGNLGETNDPGGTSVASRGEPQPSAPLFLP